MSNLLISLVYIMLVLLIVNFGLVFADVDNRERDRAPSHYQMDVESFSSLTKTLSEVGLQYYESKIFEASGYKWFCLVYSTYFVIEVYIV